MPNQVRLGVIGIGNMGSAHCRSIIEGMVPDCKLTAVADRRPSRREWARQTLPTQTIIFEEGSALIASGTCDAVLIATPHYQHPLIAIDAFKHGLHVLCEKPIGVYTLNVRTMIDEANKSGKAFALMFNQRTNCVYRKLHEIINSNELGAVKRIGWTITDWYRTQNYYDGGAWRATWDGEGGGALMNQCPHQLDLMQWLFGMPTMVRTFAHMGKWHQIEVEDDITTYLEFPNGATGVFVASTGDLPGVNRLEITFEKGRIVCDSSRIQLWRTGVNERQYCFEATHAYADDITPTLEEVPVDGLNEQHVGVLKAFTAHILRNEKLVAKGEEGLNSLLLANAMYLSAWTDETVHLPIDEERYLALLNEHRRTSIHKPDAEYNK